VEGIMMVNIRLRLALTAGFLILTLALGVEAQTLSYGEMRAEVGRLFQQEEYAEAEEVLEKALGLYPDHILANATNLATVRMFLNDPPGALAALSYGMNHGVWYSKYAFVDDLWAMAKQLPAWAEFQRQNEAAMLSARDDVRPRMEVSLPEGYDPERQYPLFLALHGGGENIDLFMPEWRSPLLQRDFIVAFPQSTQLVAMNGYNWIEDVATTLKELREAYEQVVEQYTVDREQVLIGGFSSGGVAALEVVLQDAIPVKGFVVLCPAMPDGFTPQRVENARDRGIRGTLLTTEMDGRLDQQRRMDEILTQEGLVHEFYVTPNIGHWYPEDLPNRIDRAINHILRRN